MRRGLLTILREQRRRRRVLRRSLTRILEIFHFQTRMFTPFHLLLNAESDNIGGALLQVMRIGELFRCPPSVMWFLTGETPESFTNLVDIIQESVARSITGRMARVVRRTTPEYEILLTLVWMRHYPMLAILARDFSTSVRAIHVILKHVVGVINEIIVPREVHWHDEDTWNSFQGVIPGFPDVVGMLDCSCIRINRPKHDLQRLYYRRDKGFHFANWFVVIDATGHFVHGSCGFAGHLSDADCLRLFPSIGEGRDLPLRPGQTLMADAAFPAGPHIVTPNHHRQNRMDRLQQNRNFSEQRVLVEHCIKSLKDYKVIGGGNRFRGSRGFLPHVATSVMALTNRRRKLISTTRSAA